MTAERVLPDWAKESQTIWLDDDHAVTWTTRSGESTPSGGLLWHRVAERPDSATPGWCVGGFQWKGDSGPVWTLESMEPLTLSPSIRCGCGHHGWIKNGKWIGA